jgi:hypothetical protein
MPVTRANKTFTTPPTIPNPPSSPTTGQLRTAVVAVLDCLRNAGIVAPATVPSRNTSQLDALTYTLLNSGSYLYYAPSYTMNALKDGSNTNGMMVSNAAKVFVQVQFSSDVYLNQIQLYLGQFNGPYNMPRDFSVFAGAVTSDSGTPLYVGRLADTDALQTINLSSNSAFDSPNSTYTFVFSDSPGVGNVSVGELLLAGQAI